MVSSCAPRSATVRVGDIDMAYRIRGEGPPLIMVMGFNGTMDLWYPAVLESLATRFRVIVFDNRGMGGTTAGTKTFSIGQFAEDTSGLMDALGIRQAHLLGWSMGSEIALELALQNAVKVDRVVLVAADCSMKAFPPAPDVIERLYDTTGSAEKRGEHMISLMFPRDWMSRHGDFVTEVFSRPMGGALPQNVKRQADAMDNWEGCCDRLHHLESEVLLVTGTEDVLTPPENSYMLAQKIPHARLVTFEDGGHGIMYQFPERFADTVIQFLEEVR